MLKDGKEGQEEKSIVVEDEMLTQVCKQQKEFVDEHVDGNKEREDVRKAEAKMVEAEHEMSGDYHWGPEGSVAGKESVTLMVGEADDETRQDLARSL